MNAYTSCNNYNIYNKSLVSKCRASKVFLIFSNLYSVDSSVKG